MFLVLCKHHHALPSTPTWVMMVARFSWVSAGCTGNIMAVLFALCAIGNGFAVVGNPGGKFIVSKAFSV